METKKTILFSLHFFTIITTISSSSNFTLFGTSRINQTAITLTSHLPNCTPNPINHPTTGRIFSKNPILFPHSNSSFFTHFTFQIIPPEPSFAQCGFGEGITFLITPEYNSLPYSVNCIGLPNKVDEKSSFKFLAVEFDTSFDENLGDINDNHVGIDLDSINSIASVDLMANGVDLKSGKLVSCWVEYKSFEKEVLVWVGLTRVRPVAPVLVAPVDLSKRFVNGFFYVGFSGSNGKGSSVYMVNSWEFKTFESEPGAIEVEEIGPSDCLVCFPEVTQPEYEKTGLRKNRHHTMIYKLGGIKLAIGLLVLNILLILFTVCTVVVVYMCVRKKRGTGLNRLVISRPDQTRIPKRLKLSEIRSATKGFHRNLVIGEGASAIVYKADHRKLTIAVKRYKKGSFNTQFATEYATNVAELQHRNLMKLQGWCCEKNEFILVYDYMLNGSLDKILQNQILAEKFNFSSRVNVLLGISSALVYLHEECDQHVIHKNVKTSNVMLNYDFTPKLGNIVMDSNHIMSRDITVPVRAMGYLAPEYVYSRVPSVKADVYSFGVVILEVASGRPAVDENGIVVSDWVWDLWEEKQLVSAADCNLGGKFERCEMERVLKCGLVCVHPNYEMRPVMKEVVKMLKGEMEVLLPEVKPTVMIQSVTASSSEIVAVSGAVSGVDDGLTSYGTPVSHFSKEKF